MSQPFTIDAMLRLPRLASLRLSPDGRRLVVSVGGVAPDGTKMTSSLWQVDPADKAPARRLTRSVAGEGAGIAFLPDGALLFESARPDPDAKPDPDKKVNALWALPAEGGEARLLVAPEGGVCGMAVARDTHALVFGANVQRGARDFDGDTERSKARKKAGVEALLFEAYPIRRWDHYLGPRDRHLFAAAAVDGEERIAAPVDLTADAANALIETGTADAGRCHRRHGMARQQRHHQPAGAARGDRSRERHSPDASPPRRLLVRRTLLLAGRPVGGLHARYLERAGRTHERDAVAGRARKRRGSRADAGPRPMAAASVWAPDSSAVLFTADRQGAVALFRTEIESGATTLLSSQDALSDICPTPNGAAIYALRSSYAQPPHVVRLDSRAADQTPSVIRSFAELDSPQLPGRLERLTATASDGTTVPSWLVIPRDADAEHPAPLVIWVHGGPLSSWSSWHWRWNPHLMAARGYAVLLPDPGLSTGYGQAQIGRGWGRWGGSPYTDVIEATDAALKRPDLDATRTALMGGSFGGYMANWVAGSTDRFRAIVTHASLWELRGFHGTTDFGSQWEREFGDPYVDASRYEASSPHRLLGNIRTPMLVIHGERDHRVPISEALRLWTDIPRHGVDARFLYFPDENHWILKPQNARVWYETVLAFLDQHLCGIPFQRDPLLGG